MRSSPRKVEAGQHPDLYVYYCIMAQEVMDSTTTDDGFGMGGGPWGFSGGWDGWGAWGGLQCSLAVLLGSASSRTQFAALNVPLDLEEAHEVQLAVDIAVEKILRFLAAHFSAPYLMSLGKASFSRSPPSPSGTSPGGLPNSHP